MTIYKKLNTGTAFNLNASQSGCCDNGTVCAYCYVIPNAKLLQSIVVDGVTVALNSVPTTSLATMTLVIENALAAAGYPSDMSRSINAIADTPNAQVKLCIYSTVAFGTLTFTVGTAAVETFCVPSPLCYFEFLLDVSDTLVASIVLQTSDEIVTVTIDDDYSTGNKAVLAADITTGLNVAIGDLSQTQLETKPTVKVVEVFGTAKYKVGVWMIVPYGAKLSVDGELVSPKTCKPDFTKA